MGRLITIVESTISTGMSAMPSAFLQSQVAPSFSYNPPLISSPISAPKIRFTQYSLRLSFWSIKTAGGVCLTDEFIPG